MLSVVNKAFFLSVKRNEVHVYLCFSSFHETKKGILILLSALGSEILIISFLCLLSLARGLEKLIPIANVMLLMEYELWNEGNFEK